LAPQQQQTPPQDPVTTRSLANLLLIAALVLIAVLGWSLYNEEIGLRPWRGYQARFSRVYSAYLQKRLAERRGAEKSMRASADYKKLEDAVTAARQAAKPKEEEVEKGIALADAQRAAILSTFQTTRSYVDSLTYEYEQVPATPGYKSEKQSRFREMQKARTEKHEIDWPLANGKTEKRSLDYAELNDTFNDLLLKKAGFMAQRGKVEAPVNDAEAALTAYVSATLPGLDASQLNGLLDKARSMQFDIHQVYSYPPGESLNYIGGGTLVDRCQSCHLGMYPTLVPQQMTLTNADLGLAKSKDAPFNSHPEQVLLKIHPLENFGCSTCHGGNGRGLASVEIAHGLNEHWPWPLYPPANYDAGCQNCHAADAWTQYAPVLNRGRYLFRVKGCVGCHKYDGFDDQATQLEATEHLIQDLERNKTNNVEQAKELNRRGDTAASNVEAQADYAAATDLTVENARIDTHVAALETKAADLMQEVKKVGPNLKEIRMKLHQDWVPYWLAHTHTFEPNAQMPQFRLEPDEVEAISAFIWQDALTGPAPQKQAPGNADHGKQLFMERGCLACHSIGEGSDRVGGDFAANLSRVGEKDNYDYLVRWIYNPRLRTQPYDPFLHTDLSPADYAKASLPFVFNAEHSTFEGHEIAWQNPTVMPTFRLSIEDARDIATFLETQKTGMTYAAAPFMNDPKLFAKGKALVQFYGCAGCHEIAGLEDQGRIGTELTDEGSKPLSRLDFGFLLTKAQEGILPDGKKTPDGRPWNTLRGFFERKLTQTNIFDEQRYRPNPQERLHMPQPVLSNDDRESLVTFLLGSIDDSTLPPYYVYKPGGEAGAVQKGWWIVTKYNCMGCHQVAVGQNSALSALAMYQGENSANLPPMLTFEGARVQPQWLKKFLANPALSTKDTDTNGIRSYLGVRMPTFDLSNDEISQLVSFFEAMSSQPLQYMPPAQKPLTPDETAIARAIFTSPAAPCLKCHMDGNAAHDKTASAPNLLLAGERLRPAWTLQWITNPAAMAPGTAMPSGLFRMENGRWVFNGPLPAIAKNYKGDMADLLVRYMFQMTPAEQKRVLSATPASR
jgi:cytochrome c551/c552